MKKTKLLVAQYPGRCALTGKPIAPGDLIVWDQRTRKAMLRREEEAAREAPGAALARDIDPDLDQDTAEAVGAYMTQAARRYQSDIYRVSGREYYRNKAGRCEDAPCCGCCNF
jgi:hypothetical protein